MIYEAGERVDIRGVNQANTAAEFNARKSKAADSSFEKHLEKAYGEKDEQQLKKVCKEFESIMLNMMYKQMRASVPKTDLLPSDMGRDVFESMLDEKLTEEASKGNGIGLADVLFKQLSKQTKNQYKTAGAGESLPVEEDK